MKPEETKSPKIVIKNIGEPSKNKAVLKQPELFGDPKHLDRPKSSASGEIPITSEPKIKIKKDKKSKEDHEKKRNASGNLQCENFRIFLPLRFCVKSVAHFRVYKTAIFAVFKVLNFDFGQFQPTKNAKIHQYHNSEAIKLSKWYILNFSNI